ncbi:MAG TPA: hypothetical protein VIE65_09160, partial [Methylobacter sp.]
MDIKPAWLNKVALAILRIGLTPPEGAEGPGRRKSSAPETEKKNKVRHGTERCMAANKDDLEFCRRGVDRRSWRRGILLLVCRGIVTAILACGFAGGQLARGMAKISYSGYRFPPEIIRQAIWLYLRFTLSLRDVEDLLAERGIMVSYETVRRWVNHFGPLIAADL